LGSDSFLHVKCDAFEEPLTVRANGGLELSYGSKIFVSPDLTKLHKFDKEGLRLE